MDLGWGGLFEELTDPLLSALCPPSVSASSLFFCRMSPSSINGGKHIISVQTGLPLPGAEDYILMISAHLDTVFCFTSLGCMETMEPRGKSESSAPKLWNAIVPLLIFYC